MKKLISILLVIAMMLSIFTLTVVADTYEYNSSKKIQASNGVEFNTLFTSTIKEAPDNSWGQGIGCPTVIELQHSGEKNGTLIASFAIDDSGLPGRTNFRIMESTDGGVTWKEISKVKETLDTSLEACWNPHFFELPEDFGGMPKGTLLLAGGSIRPNQTIKSHLSIWRSFDCGKTWEQFTVVAEGGGRKTDTDGVYADEGVWEPYLHYEDGYLYCFYSDDRGDGVNTPDQKIVYQRSKDGVNWEPVVNVVAASDTRYRPGMGVMAKMGNGEYFIVYEMINYTGGKRGNPTLYYKTTNDITNWTSGVGQKIVGTGNYTMGGAPWCAWTPVGGECGTLVVTGKYGNSEPNKIFVSFDYGRTFEVIDNPLPYSDSNNKGGYSSSLFFSADGTKLFYANTVDGEANKSKIDFAKISILDYFANLGSNGTVGSTVGSTFNTVISANGWNNSAKAIQLVVDVPASLTVKSVTAGGRLTGGDISYELGTDGKLRINYMNVNTNSSLTVSGNEFPVALFTITFAVKEELQVGATLTVKVDELSLIKKSDSQKPDSTVRFDVEDAKQTITVATGSVFNAGVLYTGDGVDLIPTSKKAVLVTVTQLSGVKKLTYKNGKIEFKYNKAISDKLGNNVTAYVALVDASIAIENFADASNFELSDASYAELIFGNIVGNDNKINAEDALAAVDFWIRKGNAPTDDQILAANVNGDGRIDPYDALGIVEAFISSNNEYVIVDKATTVLD